MGREYLPPSRLGVFGNVVRSPLAVSGAELRRKTVLVHSERHRTLLLARDQNL